MPARASPLLIVGMALLCACTRPRPALVLDLAQAASLADHEAPFDLVRFGTPRAEPRLTRGFFVEPAPGGERFAWTLRRARFRSHWTDARPRVLVLDMAPYPGLTTQAVEVSLNAQPVARFRLEPGRRRYRVDLPAERQVTGDNIVGLTFAEMAPPGNPHGRRLAAALYSAALAPGPAPLLESLLARDAPPALSLEADSPSPSLAQAGPTSLRYAFALPEAAEVRFRPQVHPLTAHTGTAVVMRVTLQRDGSPEEELWRSGAGPTAEAHEIVLPLRGRPGEAVRLGLHVEGPASGFGWGVWRAPRVLGRTVLPPAPRAARSRLEALRRSLAGASVLLVVLDAASARHFRCYGYPRATTTEIDRLAQEGVLFERAYTTAVFTLAAMSSLWTSLSPEEHHRGIPPVAPLPGHLLTLAELLSANDVRTAGFIANGFAGRGFGLHRGFEYFEEVYRAHGHRADAFAKAVPPWLEAHGDRRFFVYAHFREPHFPYDPLPPFNTLFGPDAPLNLDQRRSGAWQVSVNEGRAPIRPEEIAHLTRLYDGNLAYADHILGRLRREMERLGVWERTVVVVTADHGEALHEHGFIGHNHQVYEESTWIPLIIRFPGEAAPRGTRVREVVSLMDLAPTVADVLGLLQREAARSFRGRSLLPLLFAEQQGFAVSRTTGARPKYALRDGRYRHIFDSAHGQEWLYDLVADPGERHDLLAERPVLASYQRQRLHAWLMRARATDDAGEGPAAAADKETLENLRALGYVN